MHYFYRKSNWGHGICPLYRGCLPFGESIIRGFIVLLRFSHAMILSTGVKIAMTEPLFSVCNHQYYIIIVCSPAFHIVASLMFIT